MVILERNNLIKDKYRHEKSEKSNYENKTFEKGQFWRITNLKKDNSAQEQWKRTILKRESEKKQLWK